MPSKRTEILELDRLDRQLIHALLIAPRAPFSRLAEILGSSEQTVARRYRRMVEGRVIRIVGLPGPVGEMADWLVRARVRAGQAGAVAGALAAREDVAWVAIAAGGAEVDCRTRPRTPAQRDALLLERLPGASQVIGLSAHAVLHRYAGAGANEWSAFGDPLEAAQVGALNAERGPRPEGVLTNPRAEGARLAPGDEALARALGEDGRAGLATLAAATGDTPGRVRRRLDALFGSGALYTEVEIAIPALGSRTSAFLWLSVSPARLVAAAERIAAAPESAFVAAVTGDHNLHVAVACPSVSALYEFLTREVGALAGVSAAETVPIARRVKLAGIMMEGELLPEPV